MAIFNPDVADENASYLGLSKSITAPEFKSSSAIKIKAAGDLFASGIQAADTVVKQFAETETRAAMEKERDDYSKHLDETKRNIQMASVNPPGVTSDAPAVAGNSGGLNLLPDDASLPRDLKQLPTRLGTLDSALANGKITEEDFHARTTTVLKDIRSRYPVGYRAYIDDVAKDVLGHDPANALIQANLRNINSFITNKQAEKAHTLRLIESHAKYEGSAQAYQKVLNGEWTPGDVMTKFLAPAMQTENGYTVRKNQREEDAANRTIVEKDWQDDLRVTASNKVSEYIKPLHNFGDIPEGYRPGPGEIEKYTNDVRAAKAKYMADMEEYITTPDKYQNSHAKILGPAARQTIEDNAKYFDFSMDQVINDKFGIAKSNERMLDYIHKNDRLTITKDKNIGWSIRMNNAIDALAPKMTQEFFARGIGDDKVMGKRVDDFYKLQTAEMMSSDPTAIKPMKEMFKQGRVDGIDVPQFRDKWISTIDSKSGYSLLNPATPDSWKEKINITAFDPKNFGFIGSLFPDSVDAQGNRVEGKETVFKRWTKQDVADENYRLGGENWARYRNWVSHTSNTLFGEEIKNADVRLKDLPPQTEITWNDQTSQLGVNYKSIPNVHLKDLRPTDAMVAVQGGRVNTRGAGLVDTRLPMLTQAINRINVSLEAVANVGKADKGVTDANAYALRALQDAGVDLSNVKGLPKAIQDAIIAEKVKRDEVEAAGKKY